MVKTGEHSLVTKKSIKKVRVLSECSRLNHSSPTKKKCESEKRRCLIPCYALCVIDERPAVGAMRLPPVAAAAAPNAHPAANNAGASQALKCIAAKSPEVTAMAAGKGSRRAAAGNA